MPIPPGPPHGAAPEPRPIGARTASRRTGCSAPGRRWMGPAAQREGDRSCAGPGGSPPPLPLPPACSRGAGAAVASATSNEEAAPAAPAAAAAAPAASGAVDTASREALQAYLTSMSAQEVALEDRLSTARGRLAHVRAVRAARVAAARAAAEPRPRRSARPQRRRLLAAQPAVAPATHTSTGASGSGGGDDHEDGEHEVKGTTMTDTRGHRRPAGDRRRSPPLPQRPRGRPPAGPSRTLRGIPGRRRPRLPRPAADPARRPHRHPAAPAGAGRASAGSKS